MITPDFNFIAIAIAAIVPNALGALYYGPIAGNAWLSSIGKTRAEVEPKNPAIVYGGSFVLSFILLLVLPVVVSQGLFHIRSAKSIMINLTFWAVCFAIMGGIVDVWQ